MTQLRTDFINKLFTPQSKTETHTIEYNADFEEYGFWLDFAHHLSMPVTGTIAGVSFGTPVSTVPAAGQIRMPNGVRAEDYVGWVQCNSADGTPVAKSVTITYTAIGGYYNAAQQNATNSVVNNHETRITTLETGSPTPYPLTIYVDPVNGDDANDGLTTLTKKKTFASAWSIVPNIFSGNVTIDIAEGSLNEEVALIGKTPSGNYTITVQGAVNVDVSNQTANIFSNTTIGKTGIGWTVDALKGKFVEIVSGKGVGISCVIKSNTVDTITVCGNYGSQTPDGTSVFRVVSPLTIIDRQNTGQYGIYNYGQTNIKCKYLKVINTTHSAVNSTGNTPDEFIECDLTGYYYGSNNSRHTYKTCVLSNTQAGFAVVSVAALGDTLISERSWVRDGKGDGIRCSVPSGKVTVSYSTITGATAYAANANGGSIVFGSGVYVENCNGGAKAGSSTSRGFISGWSGVTQTGQSDTALNVDAATYSVGS